VDFDPELSRSLRGQGSNVRFGDGMARGLRGW